MVGQGDRGLSQDDVRRRRLRRDNAFTQGDAADQSYDLWESEGEQRGGCRG